MKIPLTLIQNIGQGGLMFTSITNYVQRPSYNSKPWRNAGGRARLLQI